MKYWVRVGERALEVIVSEETGRSSASVDGRPMDVELVEAAPGVYTLLVGGKPYDLAATPRQGGFAVAVNGVPFDVEIEDERQRRLSSAGAVKAAAEGRLSLRAPMPGRVSRVEVAEGDLVEKGQRLVVLEAMKMENDIVAPRDGRVEQVKVTQGQIADQGQLLVVLE